MYIDLYLEEVIVKEVAAPKETWLKDSEPKDIYLKNGKTVVGDNGLCKLIVQ